MADIRDMSAWQMPHHIDEGRMFHLPGNTPHKCYENSIYGAHLAADGNYDSVDWDMTKDKHHHALLNHWNECIKHDAYHDPEGVFGPEFKVSEHTYYEAHRLIAPHGIRIIKIVDGLPTLAELGLIGSLEAKGPHWSTVDFHILMSACIKNRVPAIVKSAYTRPLICARAAGFQVRYTKDHKAGM